MGERPGLSRQSKARVPRCWLVGALFTVLIVAALLEWRFGLSPRVVPSGPAREPVTVVARRETRSTLDPALFVGKVRVAHQVAREIPEVLDQLYCYCGCDKSVGHKSLLSCFTDGHAAT